MPVPRGVAIELTRLSLQVVIVAGTSAAIIVSVWETTRSAPETLLVTALLVSAFRLLHSRYRTQRTRARGRYYLPMTCPKGSTAI